MLCDAQTSGGLLVAIPKENGSRFESALASAPYPAVMIGTINGTGSIRV
jgi:selenophosphate synthase